MKRRWLHDVGAGVGVLVLLALWRWSAVVPAPLLSVACQAAGGLLLASVLARVLASERPRVAMPGPLPPADAALLVVLRDEPVSNAARFRVDVDGVRVAVLKSRRYTAVALRPGAHLLAINAPASLVADTVARFDAAAGVVVVYRLRVPFIGRPSLERLPAAEGDRRMLARLDGVEPAVALI